MNSDLRRGTAITIVGALFALGAHWCAAAENRLSDWQKVRITARVVDVQPDEVHGVALAGAWSLVGSHAQFGGFSGLSIANDELIAITDRGWWFRANAEVDGDSLRLAPAAMAPMRGETGGRLEPSGQDAEGLARLPDGWAVSFERDHRVLLQIGQPNFNGRIETDAFEGLDYNAGLEVLASLPDGGMLAMSEAPRGETFRVFRIDVNGRVSEARLPKLTRHHLTGGDVGPDGRLYLVARDFSVLRGVSIIVTRYSVDGEGLPIAETAETLAEFGPSSGIDNMEGIATWVTPHGMRIAMISDDNFNILQRTLLVVLEVLD